VFLFRNKQQKCKPSLFSFLFLNGLSPCIVTRDCSLREALCLSTLNKGLSEGLHYRYVNIIYLSERKKKGRNKPWSVPNRKASEGQSGGVCQCNQNTELDERLELNKANQLSDNFRNSLRVRSGFQQHGKKKEEKKRLTFLKNITNVKSFSYVNPSRLTGLVLELFETLKSVTLPWKVSSPKQGRGEWHEWVFLSRVSPLSVRAERLGIGRGRNNNKRRRGASQAEIRAPGPRGLSNSTAQLQHTECVSRRQLVPNRPGDIIITESHRLGRFLWSRFSVSAPLPTN